MKSQGIGSIEEAYGSWLDIAFHVTTGNVLASAKFWLRSLAYRGLVSTYPDHDLIQSEEYNVPP